MAHPRWAEFSFLGLPWHSSCSRQGIIQHSTSTALWYPVLPNLVIPNSISQIHIEEPTVKERLMQTEHWVINTLRCWHDTWIYYPLCCFVHPLLGACVEGLVGGSNCVMIYTHGNNRINVTCGLIPHKNLVINILLIFEEQTHWDNGGFGSWHTAGHSNKLF